MIAVVFVFSIFSLWNLEYPQTPRIQMLGVVSAAISKGSGGCLVDHQRRHLGRHRLSGRLLTEVANNPPSVCPNRLLRLFGVVDQLQAQCLQSVCVEGVKGGRLLRCEVVPPVADDALAHELRLGHVEEVADGQRLSVHHCVALHRLEAALLGDGGDGLRVQRVADEVADQADHRRKVLWGRGG